MNRVQLNMLDILKRLHDEHDIIGVKAEFEAEGSRINELVQLNEIVCRAQTHLFIKIGGCEAVTDLDSCRMLGVKGVIAPMIESSFAMKKFFGAAQKAYNDELINLECLINIETVTAHSNLDAILQAGKGFLKGISIGRVDLSASMGLTRADINSDAVFSAVKDNAERAKAEGMLVNFGGGISFDAVPFIQKLYPLNDRFETRKIIFRGGNDETKLKAGILLAMEFETLYLENKCAYYDRMAGEDRQRLIMLRERLEKAKSLIN